jgi:hypothetical protein
MPMWFYYNRPYYTQCFTWFSKWFTARARILHPIVINAFEKQSTFSFLSKFEAINEIVSLSFRLGNSLQCFSSKWQTDKTSKECRKAIEGACTFISRKENDWHCFEIAYTTSAKCNFYRHFFERPISLGILNIWITKTLSRPLILRKRDTILILRDARL